MLEKHPLDTVYVALRTTPTPTRTTRSRRWCERQRVSFLLYLPPYSPDLNPIEEAFSKVERLLRVIGARTKEALVEAIGKALGAVGARDARGFFTRCGYYGLKQQP